jgi:hypothetical protein
MWAPAGSDGDEWRHDTDIGAGTSDLLESGIAHHAPTSQVQYPPGPTVSALAMQRKPGDLRAYVNGSQNGAVNTDAFTFASAGNTHAVRPQYGALCELLVCDADIVGGFPALWSSLSAYARTKWGTP